MGLVAAFSPEFKMYWTRENIAHLQMFHITGVWDGCLKCYLPTSPWFYVLCLLYVAVHIAVRVAKGLWPYV